LKRLVIFLLILLPLLIGLVVALPFILTSDAMRLEFAKRISIVSGMDIALNGPVNLSIFPDLGMVAEDVALTSAAGDISVSVRKLVSGVKLATIFSDKVEITGIEMTGPRIEIDEVSTPVTDGADTGSPTESSSDPFQSAVDLLERLSLNEFIIKDGVFVSRGSDGSESIVSDINIELQAPDLDQRLVLVASAVSNGQRISVEGSLASLRPILQRQPSRADLSITMQPAPHPALADIKISGDIQLVDDGSYQIANGIFSSLGQPLRMDVLYRPNIRPGDRPYIYAALKADKVDLGAIEKQVSKGSTQETALKKGSKKSTTIDFGPLRGFDADVKVDIGQFIMDGIRVSDIGLQAVLKNGNLALDIGNLKVANGSMSGQLEVDIKQKKPTVRASLSASSLAISHLAKLADVEIPAEGNLDINIGLAFKGVDETSVRDSFNLAGTVKIARGRATISALAPLGKSAETISGLNVSVKIENIQKPVAINGKMIWKGEAIKFASRVNPRDFIVGKAGNVSFTLESKRLAGKFNGKVSTAGSANGKVNLTTKSVDRLLVWLGQAGDTGLKGFSYNGGINLTPDRFQFSKAQIVLNGIKA